MRKQLPAKGSMLVLPKQYRASAAAAGAAPVAADDQSTPAAAAAAAAAAPTTTAAIANGSCSSAATIPAAGRSLAAAAPAAAAAAAAGLPSVSAPPAAAAAGSSLDSEAVGGRAIEPRGCLVAAAAAGRERAVPPDLSPPLPAHLTVGCHVIVGGTRRGTLRYCGPVHFAADVWCGVELCAADVAAGGGKNDGSVRDVRYFSCAANTGVFVPLSKVAPACGSCDDRDDAGSSGCGEWVASSDATFVLSNDGCGSSSLAEGDGGGGSSLTSIGKAGFVNEARCCLLNETFEASRPPRECEARSSGIGGDSGGTAGTDDGAPVPPDVAPPQQPDVLSSMPRTSVASCVAVAGAAAELTAVPLKQSVDSRLEDCLSSTMDSGAGDCTGGKDGTLHHLTLDVSSSSSSLLCVAPPSPGDASFGCELSTGAPNGSPFVLASRLRAEDAADYSNGSAEKKALALLELSRKMAAAAAASTGSPVVPALPSAGAETNGSPLVLSTSLNRSMELFKTPTSWSGEQAATHEHHADHWLPDDDIANLIQLESLALAKQFEGLSDHSDEAHAAEMASSMSGSGLPGTPLSCNTPGELVTKSGEMLDSTVLMNPRRDALPDADVSIVEACDNQESNCDMEKVCARLDGTFVLSGDASVSKESEASRKEVAHTAHTVSTAQASAAAAVCHNGPIASCGRGVLDTTVTLSVDGDPMVALPAGDQMPHVDLEDVDDSFVGNFTSRSRQSSLDSLVEFGALQEPDDCSTPSVAHGKRAGPAAAASRARLPAAVPAGRPAAADDCHRPEGGSGTEINNGVSNGSSTPSPRLRKAAAREKPCSAGGATVTRKPAVSKLAECIVAHGGTGNQEKGLPPPLPQQQPHVKRNPPRSRWADISKQLEESRAAAVQQQPPLPPPPPPLQRPKSMITAAATTTDTSSASAPAAASRRMTLATGSVAPAVADGAPALDCSSNERLGGSARDATVQQQQRRRQTMAPSSLKSLAVPAAVGQRSSLIAPPTFKAPLPRPAAALVPPVNRREIAAAAAPAATLERAPSVASISSQASQSSMGAAESAPSADAVDGAQPRRRHSSLLPASAGGATTGHAVSRRSLAKSERRLKSPLPSAAAAGAGAGVGAAVAATAGAGSEAATAAGHGTTAKRQLPAAAPRRSAAATAAAGPPASSAREAGSRHQASKVPPPLSRGGELLKAVPQQLQQQQPVLLALESVDGGSSSSSTGDATSVAADVGNRPANQPDVVPCELLCESETDGGDGELAPPRVESEVVNGGSQAPPKDGATCVAAGDQVDAAAGGGSSSAAPAEEVLAAALAQVAAGVERERLLKRDGERRELENARLRCEQRRLGASVSALAVLLRYTTEELHAFSTPRLTVRNHVLERQLSEATAKVGALEAELSSTTAAAQRAAAEHEARVAQLQEEHVGAIAELHAQIEAIRAGRAEEVNDIETKAAEEKANLQNKLQTLERERDELCSQYRRVEDALTKDADVKVQLALSPYKHLPKEVESLMTVVDMKNAEIQKLRTENNESKKQLEELRAGCDRASLLEQRVESLEAAVESRVRSERELQERYDELARRCDHESREKLRLSMNCEELQYRLHDVTSSTADYSPASSPAAAMQRSFASPRPPGPAWSGATMTTSLYEPLSSSPSDANGGVRLRRSQSSGVPQPRRRRLSYERECSPVPAVPPSTPALPEQHESADDRPPLVEAAIASPEPDCSHSTATAAAAADAAAVTATAGAAASALCSVVVDGDACADDARLPMEPPLTEPLLMEPPLMELPLSAGSQRHADCGTAASSVAVDTDDHPANSVVGEQTTVDAAIGGGASPRGDGSSPSHGGRGSTKRLQLANGGDLRAMPSPTRHSPATETDV